MQPSSSISPQARPISPGRLILAVLLLLPAALVCALTQLWPTVGTLALSLQDTEVLNARSTWIGLDNYALLFEREDLARAFLFALALAFVRVLAVAVVPPVMGWAVARLSGGGSALSRGLAALPALFYLPGALGLALLLTLMGQRSAGQTGLSAWLTDPTTAPMFVGLVDGLAALAFGVSLGVVVFGAAARSAQPRKWMLVAWVASIATAAALGWQVVDLPMTLTNGGPARATMTPLLLAFQLFAQSMQSGVGAAVASLTLIPILGLGLLAGLGVALARPSLEAVDDASSQARPSGLALAGLVVGGGITAVAVLLLAWIYLVPLLSGSTDRLPDINGLVVWSDSLLSPVAGVVINLVLALLGAYAIGGLRPLGRNSLWLLLPFAPWLFVTPALHAFDWLLKYRAIGALGTWVAMIPPGFSPAVLTILAIAFFGVRATAGGRSRALPWALAVALAGVWSLSAIYDLFWQFMLSGPRVATWVMLVTRASQRMQGVDPSLWLSLWAPALSIGLGLIVWMILFGHRLRLARAE
ncbi:MAG: hypothetical protein JNL73_07885 [Anaerolineales bacterium]|nr:hypothetical protein [Anaerolineales bacterium]